MVKRRLGTLYDYLFSEHGWARAQYWRLKGRIINAGIFYNAKQKGWLHALRQLEKASQLVVLETGRIRNPAWRGTDGNSTYFFSKSKKVSRLISIDNDSENFSGFSTSMEYCLQYIPKQYLKKIRFINDDSVKGINALSGDVALDCVLLDSANDPELIYNEFLAVKRLLNPAGAVVIIDDVSPPGKKGDKLIPYLKSLGYAEHRIGAHPGNAAWFKL